MDKTETVYDSTDIQLRTLNDITATKLTLDDLAKPAIVQLILERHTISLTELKAARAEITELRGAIARLMEDRENLRIAVAKSKERQSVLLIEIPAGILSGFAVNMLTQNSADKIGWILLILSLILILVLRFPQIVKSIGKGNDNA